MLVKHYVIKDGIKRYDYINRKAFEKDLKLFNNPETYEYEMHEIHLLELTLINNKGQEFEKGFDDINECRKFINKVKRGNSLIITLIKSFSSAALKEIRI